MAFGLAAGALEQVSFWLHQNGRTISLFFRMVFDAGDFT